MRHPSPLPPDLPDRFRVADARARGLSKDRLGRGDLNAPYRGVRTRLASEPPATLREACLRYAPRLKPWQFFSHETALALQGVPIPEWPYQPRIHVSTHRPAREPRIGGVIGHRLQTREPDTRPDADGLPLEDPVRAWRQCGTLWAADDLTAAGEFLISGEWPLASIDDLSDEVRMMGDATGGTLTRALREMRVGARSPRETRLRLALVRAGLPEPEITWNLCDGDGFFVAELDLAFIRYRVGVEYDGRVHAEDPSQFRKDADRWDSIRAQDWDHVRILSHHMQGGAVAAVRKVRDALIRAGWRPGLS